MEPITQSVVDLLGRYAPDKGAQLSQTAGQVAVAVAQELFLLTLQRVREVDPRTAERFPANPEGYRVPLADALAETLQSDAGLAAQLKGLLERYERAAQAHDADRTTLSGGGALAQDHSAAASQGGVAVGGDVGGDVVAGSRHTAFDQRDQQVGQQINVSGNYTVQQAATPSFLDPELAQGWNTEALRQLLAAAFSDGEIVTLCFDHFRPVYEEFSAGMAKGDKIQRLLYYCLRQGQVELLLAQVQQRNPAQYARFAGRLRE